MAFCTGKALFLTFTLINDSDYIVLVVIVVVGKKNTLLSTGFCHFYSFMEIGSWIRFGNLLGLTVDCENEFQLFLEIYNL